MKLRQFLVGLLAVWIAACGGGGGVGEGGTGSFSSGPISGFGSVIVNGVRFDDASATVSDDDGAVRRRDELRLGMVVAIDSTRIDAASASASARTIRIGSEILALVTGVDVAGGSFSVFGQPVRVTTDTIFDDRLAGGLAALRIGDAVEVYGFFDRARVAFVATRVEPKPPAAAFKLRAPLQSIDQAARIIVIGGQPLSIAGVALPPGLAAGAIVRVRFRLTGAGALVTRIELAALQVADRDDVRVEGRITSIVSSRNFNLDGLAVDASSASFPDGEAGVVLGARVEVEGAVAGGTLVAAKVEVEEATPEFRLQGPISGFDSAARAFVVRGVAVRYPPGVRFDDGSEADLADGRNVEVRGIPFGDGTGLLATRIRFEP